MKQSVYKSYDELPLFFNAELVGKVLGISSTTAYELMHRDDFPSIKIGNRLMGTREGVEKLPNGIDHKPATKKQRELICECITAVPESLMYPELKMYQEQETRYTASEFLDAFIERNADRIDGVKKLVQYYGERPGVEKLGRHGLFSQTDGKIDIDKIADEVSNHEGILWTHVISLRREDAERLGYNNAQAWKELVRRNALQIAEAHKIAPSEMQWYVNSLII